MPFAPQPEVALEGATLRLTVLSFHVAHGHAVAGVFLSGTTQQEFLLNALNCIFEVLKYFAEDVMDVDGAHLLQQILYVCILIGFGGRNELFSLVVIGALEDGESNFFLFVHILAQQK